MFILFVFSPHQGDREINFELDEKTKSSEVDEAAEENKSDTEDITANLCPSANETLNLSEGGKKDSLLRRQELLVNSGLAEVCCFSILPTQLIKYEFIFYIYLHFSFCFGC